MRALQGLVVVVAIAGVGCKGKSPEPTTGSGSATAGSATGSGSADTGSATGSAQTGSAATGSADTGSAAAAGSPKVFDGPSFTVSSTLTGPETVKKDIDTDAGPTTMTMYEFEDPSDGNRLEMVETNPAKWQPGSEQKVMQASMDGMTGNVKATIDDKKTITVDGTKMLDFSSHFSDEDGVFFFRGRVTVKNGLLYQVAAMGKGTQATPAAEAFVTSFHLK
jgi:hypothetical protein